MKVIVAEFFVDSIQLMTFHKGKVECGADSTEHNEMSQHFHKFNMEWTGYQRGFNCYRRLSGRFIQDSIDNQNSAQRSNCLNSNFQQCHG